MPTLRRSIGIPVTSALLNSTRPPASGVSRPAMMRNSVVLPQPDGPSRTTVSPRATSSETGSSARVPSPKVLPQAASRSATPCVSLMIDASWPFPFAARAAGAIGGELHRREQRDDHHEEHQRIGGGDLEPHRGVAVG